MLPVIIVHSYNCSYILNCSLPTIKVAPNNCIHLQYGIMIGVVIQHNCRCQIRRFISPSPFLVAFCSPGVPILWREEWIGVGGVATPCKLGAPRRVVTAVVRVGWGARELRRFCFRRPPSPCQASSPRPPLVFLHALIWFLLPCLSLRLSISLSLCLSFSLPPPFALSLSLNLSFFFFP